MSIREKRLTERIAMYHKDIGELDRDRLLVEIATNLFAIFLRLKELTSSVDSISIPEDKSE